MTRSRSGYKWLALLTLLSLAGPLLGLSHSPVAWDQLLEFPPRSPAVTHAPFDPLIFAGYLLTAVAAAGWLLMELRLGFSLRQRFAPRAQAADKTAQWKLFACGVAITVIGWGISWGALPYTAALLPFAFPILWSGYCLAVEGIVVIRGGEPSWRCFRHYWALIPVSAGFWWLFEYLNRFVQNWSYLGAERFNAGEYACYATLSFATVLPAVLATSRLLESFQLVPRSRPKILRPQFSRTDAVGLLLAGLTMFGLTVAFPTQLFALLWLAPLVCAAGLLTLSRGSGFRAAVLRGDWNFAIRWSLAALVCGFFWEGWNSAAILKWVYHIPYVEALYVFEMPLPGLAGYLPFGILCGIVTHWCVEPR